MGLLLTALIIGIGIVVFAALVFVISLFFQPLSWAMYASGWVVVGAVGGVALAGALAVLIADVDVTFVTSSKRLVYFSSLALGGFVGGGLMFLLFTIGNRSNPTFRKDR